MTNIFEDESLGLKLRGYNIVPNSALETKIAIYTSEIVQSILLEHPDIVDSWLQKLHDEYIHKKKLCDFENDPVACFTLSVYEQFEKHFKSWEDGGLITINMPTGNVIRVSKKPLVSIVEATANSGTGYFVCNKCLASFTNIDEFAMHCKQENEAKPVQKNAKKESVDNTPPNPIWWLSS
jgi:hypothetical protein